MINQMHAFEKKSIDSKIVYYFSGTGNSYYLAKIMAENIGAVLKPIVLLKEGDIVKSDLACFVFPVYDFKAPKIVEDIILSLSAINSKNIIAIGTYGVALANTLKHFNKTLKQINTRLTSGFGIKMPHMAVGSAAISDEDIPNIIVNAENKLERIINYIKMGKTGVVEKTSFFEDMTIIKQFPVVMKILFILIFKGEKALRFRVTSDCISCAQCQKICPVNNIKIVEGKPMFGDNCTSCFACIQWCPKSAINIGKYSFDKMSMRHYHHPKVKVNDLIIDKLL